MPSQGSRVWLLGGEGASRQRQIGAKVDDLSSTPGSTVLPSVTPSLRIERGGALLPPSPLPPLELERGGALLPPESPSSISSPASPRSPAELMGKKGSVPLGSPMAPTGVQIPVRAGSVTQAVPSGRQMIRKASNLQPQGMLPLQAQAQGSSRWLSAGGGKAGSQSMAALRASAGSVKALGSPSRQQQQLGRQASVASFDVFKRAAAMAVENRDEGAVTQPANSRQLWSLLFGRRQSSGGDPGSPGLMGAGSPKGGTLKAPSAITASSPIEVVQLIRSVESVFGPLPSDKSILAAVEQEKAAEAAAELRHLLKKSQGRMSKEPPVKSPFANGVVNRQGSTTINCRGSAEVSITTINREGSTVFSAAARGVRAMRREAVQIVMNLELQASRMLKDIEVRSSAGSFNRPRCCQSGIIQTLAD